MNAISLNRMLDKAAVKMAERYYDKSDTSEADMVYLMPEDFETEMGEENLDELLAELENLTGLHAVKAELRKRIEAIVAQQKAEEAGSERKDGNGTLHMLFTGNPGTGKTTVARLVGRIYQALGVLPRGGNMVECTRSDLVGQYQGHTALKVREKVKEAMGGVLFIDEAYALCRDDKDTFGHEAVDELIAAIENSRGSMMVILAGYKKEMKEFLKSNPGFSSRIRKQIEFEDYSVDEMTEIFQSMVRGKKMQLAPDANEALQQMLEVRSKIPDFGNARGVRNLFEEVVEALNERLVRESVGMPLSGEQYDTICKEDIECVAGKKLEGEKTLEELLEELNSLTGLGSVKAKVQEMVDDLQVKAYMKEQGLDVAEGHGTLHMVFKGNAGTGKTTVARLIGQIYRKLGVLKKNVFVEVGRKDLVANYLGQTATLVLKKVEEADGGILFIDEAYTLVNGAHDDFGLEAVNTLVAELENRRASLMVIVAGYADEMQKFLDANQGLASRLSNEILFEDYTIDELMSIFVSMVKKKGMLLSPGLEESVRQMITEEKAAVKDFGNARGVRNILERIEKKKSSRIAARMRAGDTPSREEFMTITQEDLA
jgi:SpoVK/Ycf46/Vps4 family AAA+-type ATPase